MPSPRDPRPTVRHPAHGLPAFRAPATVRAAPALRALAASTALPAVAVAGALLGALGCSHRAGGSGGPDDPGHPSGACDVAGGPSTASAAFGGLDYAIVGGFTGQGDGTTLHIAADGAFGRHTMLRGDEQGMLDPAALQDLIARARAAEFPSLCQLYPAPGAGDDLVTQVSVHLDATTLTVQVSEFADPPDRLQALLDALQLILDRPLR